MGDPDKLDLYVYNETWWSTHFVFHTSYVADKTNSNYFHFKMWYEMTNPYPNFNVQLLHFGSG